MPIYEYHCNNCNKNFEYLVFGKEEPICPACKNKKVGRVLSACGFVSKGSGGEQSGSLAGKLGKICSNIYKPFSFR
ncbi:MAG: zinc ribbon domain-containing protein [Deltaproteobacteria bacterium]|nr:zinc ribbon domain-containing protein [Deltaproteobacteria bacterium]